MNGPVFVIAEAGVNHNGDLQRALELIDAAAECGADAVKFQTFIPEQLAAPEAARADYQARQLGGEQSQLEMLRGLALSFDDHFRLQERCTEREIEFLSSPFDTRSADFLLGELKLSRIKLGSGELTNGPLLLRIARAKPRLILSTGMASLAEVEEALGVLVHGYADLGTPASRTALKTAWRNPEARASLSARVALLHCTTEYPCPIDQVNLRAMDTLAETFGLPVGYSDHTDGIAVALMAASRGARVIEKHLTLDRQLPGPDQAASLEPHEMQTLIALIREIPHVLGNADKRPTEAEAGNSRVARKSLFAARDIAAGTTFTTEDLIAKRPGDGRSPMDIWDLLRRESDREYRSGNRI